MLYEVITSRITKLDYMNAMMQSPTNSSILKTLLNNALTTKINDREMYMKGIDYSYYYRITSYNVCYTKLLRFGYSTPIHAFFEAFFQN